MAEEAKEQSDRIDFYPLYKEKVGEEARTKIDELNSHLKERGMDVDIAKTLFINKSILNIPDPIKDSAQKLLVTHYGLSTEKARFGEISVEEDVQACINLENFGVEPALALKEYKEIDWGTTLNPYRTSDRVEINFPFSSFVESCKKAIIYERSNQLKKEAKAEKERILALSKEEWEKLRRGVMWSQGGYANDREREMVGAANQMVEAIKLDIDAEGLMSVDKENREKVLEDEFLHFETTRAIKKGSIVKIPPYGDMISPITFDRHKIFQIDDLLQAVPRE